MNIVTSDKLADTLLGGAVGVMPTDTVYGLVARAEDPVAVSRMYALKARERKPGTLIAASTGQLQALGVSADDLQTVAHLWPNPLSAVLRITNNGYLHQNVGSLAMRVVADPTLRLLLEKTGPLITSSANQPGAPPATNLHEAYAYFADTVDFYVDGGTVDAESSTIVCPTPDGIEVLRHGSITL